MINSYKVRFKMRKENQELLSILVNNIKRFSTVPQMELTLIVGFCKVQKILNKKNLKLLTKKTQEFNTKVHIILLKDIKRTHKDLNLTPTTVQN